MPKVTPATASLPASRLALLGFLFLALAALGILFGVMAGAPSEVPRLADAKPLHTRPTAYSRSQTEGQNAPLSITTPPSESSAAPSPVFILQAESAAVPQPDPQTGKGSRASPQQVAQMFFNQARQRSLPMHQTQAHDTDASYPFSNSGVSDAGISANGQRVFVENAELLSDGSQVALDLVMVPEPNTPALSSPASDRGSTLPLKTDLMNLRIGQGFTPEELAFRARWGWAGHDAALRAAFLGESSAR